MISLTEEHAVQPMQYLLYRDITFLRWACIAQDDKPSQCSLWLTNLLVATNPEYRNSAQIYTYGSEAYYYIYVLFIVKQKSETQLLPSQPCIQKYI